MGSQTLSVPGVTYAEWVTPGQVARGAQPPHTIRTLDGLARHGIRDILSLRCDDEPLLNSRRPHRYRVEHERAVCAIAGLGFHHVRCTDLAVPTPEQVLQSLAVVDNVLALGRSIYLHCRAGLGRTGVVTAAWLMARAGADLETAGASYRDPFHAVLRARGLPEAEWPTLLTRIGVAEQWWAIQAIGSVLGLAPASLPGLPEPRPPADVESHQWIAAVERGLSDHATTTPAQVA